MTPLEEVLVTRTYNSLVAGHRASPAMAEVLRRDWLPAMSLAMAHGGTAGKCWPQVRRLLSRFAWLLQRLPAGGANRAAMGDAMREFRTSLHECAPMVFPDAARRAVVLQVMGDELLAASRATVESRNRLPRVEAIGTVAATAPAAEQPGLAGRAARLREGAAPAGWEGVIGASRERKRAEDEALSAMTQVAKLRAGDRVALRTGAGVETWRVVRSEPTRKSILFTSEDRDITGVLGLAMLAQQLKDGSLTILAAA